MKKNPFKKFLIFFLSFSIFIGQLSPNLALAFDAAYWNLGGTSGGSTNPATQPENKEAASAPANCEAKTGDPVYLHSGEFYYSCEDLNIPGREMDVVITHTYRSGRNTNKQYGYGWNINYHEWLNELSDGTVVLISGDSEKVRFTYDANSNSYVSPSGYFETLVRNGNGTWTITKNHGLKHNYNISGLLESIVDKDNNQITFAYSTNMEPVLGVSLFSQNPLNTNSVIAFAYRMTSITDTVGRVINFNYNAKGRLSTIVDYTGRTVTYNYDANTDDLLSITKPVTTQFPSGLTKSFTYNTNHDLLTITDPKGQIFVTNTYDPLTGKISSQNLGTGTFTFTYPSLTQTVVTDRRGLVTTYDFNANGNAIRKEIFTQNLRPTDPASFITTYEYTADGMMTAKINPAGNGLKYLYDNNNSNPIKRGNLLEVRHKSNMSASNNNTNDLVTTFTYEPNFNFIKTKTDPKGNITTYTYDYELLPTDPNYGTKGNLVGIETPAPINGGQRPTILFAYNAFGQTTQITDPNGNVTQLTYDVNTGYLTSVIRDPNPPAGSGHINAITTFTYDLLGNISSATDPNNNTTTYIYNVHNWLLEETNALGFKTKHTYDANSNIIRTERQASIPVGTWQTTEYTYTILNDLTSIKDPLNRITTFGYDANQNRTSMTDALSRVTNYEFDERDLIFKVRDANTPQGITQYDYDINANLSKIIDANNNQTTYTYDGFDRQNIMTYANSTYIDYDYDKNSNILQKRLPDAHNILYAYDNLNRLISKNYPQNPTTINATFSYDLGSRLITANNSASQNAYVHDTLNRVIQNTQTLLPSNLSFNVGYTYDAAGNMTNVIYPINIPITRTYDALNRFTGTNIFGIPFVDFTYDTLNRVTSRYTHALAPQQIDYQYDLANQSTAVNSTLIPAAITLNRNYTYDNVGNRLSKQLLINGTLPFTLENYIYNSIDELTSVTGQQNHSYSYDNVGNRIVADSQTYTTSNLNQIIQQGATQITHDLKGNTTNNGINSLVFDDENRVSTFSNSFFNGTYSYDAFNRRVSKTVNGLTTYYAYDGDQIIQEHSGGGAFEAVFIYGNSIDEPLIMYRAGSLYPYHHDALGNIDLVFDWSGNPIEFTFFDVYGQPSTIFSAIGNPYLFTGRQFDPETGLYYYRNRYYDPQLGRFLSRDPIGYYDSMNLYQYVGNNPTNYVDPMGLCEEGTKESSWQDSALGIAEALSKALGFAKQFDVFSNSPNFSDSLGLFKGGLGLIEAAYKKNIGPAVSKLPYVSTVGGAALHTVGGITKAFSDPDFAKGFVHQVTDPYNMKRTNSALCKIDPEFCN